MNPAALTTVVTLSHGAMSSSDSNDIGMGGDGHLQLPDARKGQASIDIAKPRFNNWAPQHCNLRNLPGLP
jgi:hypothetical protein